MSWITASTTLKVTTVRSSAKVEERRQETVETEGCEDCQIQQPDCASLQRHRIRTPRLPKPPAHREKHEGSQNETDQPVLDRQQPAVGRVPDEKSCAEEEDDDTHFGNDVPGREELDRSIALQRPMLRR